MLRKNGRANECPYYLDLSTPSAVQMKSVVKGHDPYYRIGHKRSWFWRSYAVLIFVVLLAVFGSLFIIAEVAK